MLCCNLCEHKPVYTTEMGLKMESFLLPKCQAACRATQISL